MASPLAPGLIVNADDLGIHPSINAGIVSAYRRGILTSCTMLMTTAYFDQTISDHVRPQALPIGIHLSLTLGKAVAPHSDVPDLVDADGNLKLAADRLILSAFKGERGGAVLRQIGREFEAQLAIARDHGLRSVDVRVSGPCSGRESAIRALASAGVEVRSIRDVTPMPHNGCRPPKRRRV